MFNRGMTLLEVLAALALLVLLVVAVVPIWKTLGGSRQRSLAVRQAEAAFESVLPTTFLSYLDMGIQPLGDNLRVEVSTAPSRSGMQTTKKQGKDDGFVLVPPEHRWLLVRVRSADDDVLLERLMVAPVSASVSGVRR